MNYGNPHRNSGNSMIDLNKEIQGVDLTVNGTVNPVLLKTYAEKYGKIEGMTSTQLRKFYNEVAMLDKRLTVNSEKFESVYPLILMLKSKLAYTAGKEKNKGKKDALNSFMKFMEILVDKVSDEPEKGEKDFKALKLFFEAVVGYYTFYNK